MANQKYALLSVSDKTGIEEIAGALVKHGVMLLSTGGTYKTLKEAGLPVQTVESITGFPEIMDGRVKTLHPKIHGGLLARRHNANHLASMVELDISPIDYVIVNLYPFKETVSNSACQLEEAIEQIDIGGPSMLRSAAKNYESVSVVTDPRDYATLIDQLNEHGRTTPEFRAYLARKVFALTAYYDNMIATYLAQQAEPDTTFDQFPWRTTTMSYDEKQVLRYGENAHQSAIFYEDIFPKEFSIAQAQQLHGKALSYNNIKDADAAIRIVREFDEPCAVAVKHMNPCGVAIGDSIEVAFERCYRADSVSIFGGIVALNRPVTLDVATQLQPIFLEIVIAPSYDDDAFALLSKKKNLRLLTLDFNHAAAPLQSELVSVMGGLLVQSGDESDELTTSDAATLLDKWEVMTEQAPTEQALKALLFNMRVCKHVKSNAIVIGNDYMTLGIGAGQMNRVGSAHIALEQAKAQVESDKSLLVMASDAFFPMDDTVKLAQQYGVTAIAQPGGSIRDDDSVTACNDANISMVKTHIRHFRH